MSVAGIRLRQCEVRGCSVGVLFLLAPAGSDGDIAFRAGFDQGVAILRPLAERLFQLGYAPFEALQHLFGFLSDVGELAVGQIRHIGNENLAVVAQCQKRGARGLPVTAGTVI